MRIRLRFLLSPQSSLIAMGAFVIFLFGAQNQPAYAAAAAEQESLNLVPRERPRLAEALAEEVQPTHLEGSVRTRGYPYEFWQLGDSLYHYSHHHYSHHPIPWYLPMNRSTIWASVGSNDYVGGGFATRQSIADSPFAYGISVSREEGQLWWTDVDYAHLQVSPWLEWHGRQTSAYLGVTAGTTNYSGDVGLHHPLVWKPEAHDAGWFELQLRERAVWGGITHQLFENVSVSLSAGYSEFKHTSRWDPFRAR